MPAGRQRSQEGLATRGVRAIHFTHHPPPLTLDFYYRPYVSVAKRRQNAEKEARKLARNGRILAPVRIEGRKISKTFWGTAWCDNLESYSDYANRLPRGRTYVRNGSVIDLQLSAGKITALVQGSELYEISIEITALAAKRWKDFTRACSGKVANLLDLLQGRLSKEILSDITAKDGGLFPSPKEIKLTCSCPDWADMCKHVAAVLYGIGARLDEKPEDFFALRGVDMQDLITAAGASAAGPIEAVAGTAGSPLDENDLSEIFGVELEPSAPAKPAPDRAPRGKKQKPAGRKKPARAKAMPATKAKSAAKTKPADKAKQTPKKLVPVKQKRPRGTAPSPRSASRQP